MTKPFNPNVKASANVSTEGQNSDTVTIDKGKLENLLALITSRVSVMGQLGSDLENMCETMNESLTVTQDKS